MHSPFVYCAESAGARGFRTSHSFEPCALETRHQDGSSHRCPFCASVGTVESHAVSIRRFVLGALLKNYHIENDLSRGLVHCAKKEGGLKLSKRGDVQTAHNCRLFLIFFAGSEVLIAKKTRLGEKSQPYPCLVSQAYPNDICQALPGPFGVVAPRRVGAHVVSTIDSFPSAFYAPGRLVRRS